MACTPHCTVSHLLDVKNSKIKQTVGTMMLLLTVEDFTFTWLLLSKMLLKLKRPTWLMLGGIC